MNRFPTTATLAALILLGCAPAGDDTSPTAESSPETVGSPAESPPSAAAAHMPADADRTAILGTVQALFDALEEGDGQILRDIMHPDVLMHSVERAGDGSRSSSTSTRDQLIARLEGSEQVLTERMWDPEVRISGDLAMVWTPYDFYVGDELSHCGADAFLLTRSGEDSWLIIALSWTRLQPPTCELHPDGPPA